MTFWLSNHVDDVQGQFLEFWRLFQEGKSAKFSILGRLGNASSLYGTSFVRMKDEKEVVALAPGKASLI
jgi:hypothetical protein